jgi:hypothetical protein
VGGFYSSTTLAAAILLSSYTIYRYELKIAKNVKYYFGETFNAMSE